MPPVDFLNEVRSRLPANQAQRLITRLRCDPLVWASLHNEGFVEKALSVVGGNLASWSPASLARLALDGGWVETTGWILNPAEAQQASRLFEEAARDHRMAVNLREAGLIAAALLERWQQTNNLMALIETNAGEPENRLLALWRTPLACLYGMLADPMILLRELMAKKTGVLPIAWISHCILANPLELSEQVRILSNLMTGISPALQVNWLRYLQLAGHSELVDALARSLLTKVPLVNTSSLIKHVPEKADLELNVVRLVELLRLVGLYRYSNQTSNARAMAQKASQTLAHLNARLNLQLADLDVCDGLLEPAIEHYIKGMSTTSSGKEIPTESLMALASHGSVKPILENIPEDHSSPIVRLYRASEQYDRGEVWQARESAAKAASQIDDLLSSQPIGLVTQFLPDWQPVHLVQTLQKMDLVNEALSCAEKLLESRPSDTSLLEAAAQLSQNQQQLEKAYEHSAVLQIMEPENADRARQSANLLEKMDRWDAARSELIKVTQKTEPQVEDWIGIGRCSLHLQDWNKVLEVSDHVLEREPENGKACALKGQALMSLGRQEDAVLLLNQATLLAPEEAEPWLALARMQADGGEDQRSIDIMKAAVLAVPNSAEINFRLGKAFIRGGLFSDGLPFLRKASILAPESVEVTLDLGRTLMALGHHEEARKVLARGRQRWPKQAEMAYTFAELSKIFGDREGTLSALDVAMQSPEVKLEWYLTAAKSLTGYDPDGNRPEPELGRLITVQLGLEKVIDEQPGNLEARLLVAEVLVARKEYAKAYDIFQSLIEPCAGQPGLRWRVQAGLGETTLNMGMLENAVVSLKDAVQNQPDDPRLHRLLAEAYKAGKLGYEAACSARDALKLAPDGHSMLVWYAGFMSQLGDSAEAIQALRTATQLAPEDVSSWIMLASMLLNQEKRQEAEVALLTALGLEGLTQEHLRQIAGVYLSLGQPSDALEAMMRAKQSNVDPQYSTELAYLYMVNKRFEDAYEALQPAVNRLTAIPWLVIFQADLLTEMGRYEAAAACLEHARQMVDGRISRPAAQMIESDLIPVDWLTEIQQPYAVSSHYAQLERRTGNLAAALRHAEAAIETKPEHVELHSFAADLASAMLDHQQAAHLADMPTFLQSPIPQATGRKNQAAAILICQQAEVALEAGNLDSATQLIEKVEEINADFPRLWAVKARTAAMNGDWKTGLAAYSKMKNSVSVGSSALTESGRNIPESNSDVSFWRAQAALDMMDWNEAMVQIQSLAKIYPGEPRVLLGLVKATVLAQENARLCGELQVATHAPNLETLGYGGTDQLESAIAHLERSINSPQVESWKARGRAVFGLTGQNLHSLSALLPAEDAAAALVAALRAAGNLSGAIEVAQDYPNSVPVLVQLALTHMSADLSLALKTANRAAELTSGNPVVQAILAMALQKNGYTSEALDAWESALESWGDEPKWRAKAGYLASALGDMPAAIEHWQQAVKLDPSNLDHFAELSRVYISDNQYAKALETLQDAIKRDENRAELWYLMSQAKRQMRQLRDALDCAEKAHSLDQTSIQPLLLGGEITLQMGDPKQALEYARQALAVQPRDESAILFQVKVNYSIGKPEDAITLLEKSITPDSSVKMVLEYAKLVYRQRGAQAALPLLKKITTTAPDEVGALQLLAHAQEETGETAGAEQTAYQALQLEPNQPDLNCMMGRLKRVDGQLDQSVHYLSEAIRQDPEAIDAYLELGKTYQDRREMVQALRIYEKAIQTDASNYRPYYQAGIVLRESKDYRGAENMLRRAAELAPNDVNIRRSLGAVITLNLIHNSQEVSTIHEL